MNLTLSEKDVITWWIIDTFELRDESSILTAKLLYDYEKDGKSAKDWHAKCDDNINTFTIVETEFNNHILLVFYRKIYYLQAGLIKDNKAFLCGD